MVMLGINVEKSNENIVIKYQLAKVEIPISDIIEVTLDDTYAGTDMKAIRIGSPYGTTDRVLIKTKTNHYILFTANYTFIINKINSAIAGN